MTKRPSPEVCLKRHEEIKKDILIYQNSSRIHQLAQAEGAYSFSGIFFKTLFLFNSGAFVLLPTYYTLLENKSDLNFYVISSIMIGFLVSAFLLFFSVISAYFSSVYGAESERDDTERYSNCLWAIYSDFAKNTKDKESYDLEQKIKEKDRYNNKKKSDWHQMFAVVLSFLSLLIFFFSSFLCVSLILGGN